MDENDALDAGATAQSASPDLEEDIVGDVGAGAVAGEEDPTEIAVFREPGIRTTASGVGRDPAEGGQGIVVRGRKGVLGGEAIVEGHGEYAGAGDDGVNEMMVGGREGRSDDEAAAVEVDENRELSLGVYVVGEEEANRDAGGGVNDNIPRGDDGVGGGGRDEIGRVEAFDAAALEEVKVRGVVVGDLGVGIHQS